MLRRILSKNLAICAALLASVPTATHAQSDYAQRMHRASNDNADVLRTGTFYNPKLKAFWEAWRRAKGNAAIVPDLSEVDLAYLEEQIDIEWEMRGRPKPSILRPGPPQSGQGSWDPNLVPYSPPPGPSWGRP